MIPDGKVRICYRSGTITIEAESYFAWWSINNPDTLCVRDPLFERPDFMGSAAGASKSVSLIELRVPQ